MNNPLDSIAASVDRYYQHSTGFYIPNAVKARESSSRAMQVSPYNATIITLEQYIKQQLQQSRYKYFVYGEMYRRDTWIRSVIDYVARRSTRDPDRLVDKVDPLNPDIRDLQEFLDDCNPDFDLQELKYGWAQDVLKFQAAYAHVEKPLGRGRKPKNIWTLDARITFPVYDFHGTILFFAQVFNGRTVYFNRDEILYFPINNNGANQGVPCMETLAESVAMELNANRFNSSLFENHLNLGHIFSMPGASDEEVADNQRYLEDRYQKPENAWKHLILRGDAKIVQAGQLQGAKDISFEELIRVARQRVCSVFGVPEALLGIVTDTNKATMQSQERDTYVNTVRPLKRLINRRFTKDFIRRDWNSRHIVMMEPVSSMITTSAEIEAVLKVAQVGAKYNDILEMLGLDRVPGGDSYMVALNPGNGQYQRLDLVMPGLGDPRWDPVAYQLMHEAEAAAQAEQAAVGLTTQANPNAPAWMPPAPQDQIQWEPIAARIIDVSRSLAEDWIEVSRRNPMAPGSRGGSPYRTRTGGLRYGKPPAGKRPEASEGGGPDNTSDLSNPADPAISERVTPEVRLAMDNARTEVSEILREAQDNNWDTQQFVNALSGAGWEEVKAFVDVRDARAHARSLAEQNPDVAYTLVGMEGRYTVMQHDLSAYQSTGAKPGEGKQKRELADAAPVARSMTETNLETTLSDWEQRITRYLEAAHV